MDLPGTDGRVDNLFVTFFLAFLGFFYLFAIDAASKLVCLTRGIVCHCSNGLEKEKKIPYHI